nr:hypothetical protein [Prevotella sp.]
MAVNQNFKESTVSTGNHTQNYDLPLWTEGDKTSWLTQVNDAMNKIDSGMVDAKSKALEVVGIAADAKKLAEETSAESKESAKIVAGYNDRLTAVEATSVEHTDDITALNTRCDQMDVEIHSVKETQKKTTEDLGTLADQVKHNKEDADATKQSVSVLNGNVIELTGRVTTCEDDIEALKVTTAANTKNIAQAEENVATVTGKVTALETEVGEVSAATQSNTTAIGAINGSIESIKAKDSEQDGKISANTTEISSLDGRVTALEDGGGSGSATIVKTKKYSSTISTGMELYARNDNLAQVIGVNSLILVNEYSDGTVYIDATFRNGASTTPTLSNIDRTSIKIPNSEIVKDFPILSKSYITIGSGNLHVQSGSYPNLKDSYYVATCRNFDASSANVTADIYNDPMTVSAGTNSVVYSMSMMLRKVNLNDSE